MNEDENEDIEGEQTSDRTLGAKIRQAMSTLEGDLAGIETEDTEVRPSQTGSEPDKNESGSSQSEMSSSGISLETEGVFNDSVEIDKQEEEMQNKFVSKVAKSQELFKEVFNDFLAYTKFQFVFKDQDKNDVSLSRADVIRLYNHHMDSVNDCDKKTQEIIDLQKRNEELVAEKGKWLAEKESMSKAEEDIKKMFQSMRSENEKLKKGAKESEDAEEKLKKDLSILGREKKKLMSDTDELRLKRKEQKTLIEKMEREKEDHSKQILKKDIEIEDLTKSVEKKRKELKALRVFKEKVFCVQEEMVTEAVRCENEKWLDLKEGWLSDKKVLDDQLEEEKEKSTKLNLALTESREQIKKLQGKNKDLSGQVQKANTDLYRANIQLLSVGKGDLAKTPIKSPKEPPKPRATITLQENIIQIDSD